MTEIMFEVIPYAKVSSHAYKEKVLNEVSATLNELKIVKMVNIPDFVEENHIGLPYYKNVGARDFGSLLRERCKKDIMVNTVVVHYGKERFEQWLDETITEYKINNFVFVGAKVEGLQYPGPNVAEANEIAAGKKVNFGNIVIPQRPNEAERLLQKTLAGCQFFTSQVLFEAEHAREVILEYGKKCREAKLKPAKFFLSFWQFYSKAFF